MHGGGGRREARSGRGVVVAGTADGAREGARLARLCRLGIAGRSAGRAERWAESGGDAVGSHAEGVVFAL